MHRGDEPSFDAVVADLTRIVEDCRSRDSALGVFPAMYRTVTTTVGEGIDAGAFDAPDRVERLVAVFAQLYVDAFDAHASADPDRPVPAAWDLAFRFAERGRGSLCQHLLLGMNAHINLDLGIATAAVATPVDLPALRSDFVRVNDVLFTLLDALQAGLGEVSPWMARLDRLGLGFDELCLRSGIALARTQAWEFAEALTARPHQFRAELVAERDAATRQLGLVVCHRFSALNLANRAVAWRECRDTARVIDVLGGVRIDVRAMGLGPAD